MLLKTWTKPEQTWPHPHEMVLANADLLHSKATAVNATPVSPQKAVPQATESTEPCHNFCLRFLFCVVKASSHIDADLGWYLFGRELRAWDQLNILRVWKTILLSFTSCNHLLLITGMTAFLQFLTAPNDDLTWGSEPDTSSSTEHDASSSAGVLFAGAYVSCVWC